MPNLSPQLTLNRCPHCSIANPNLGQIHRTESNDHAGQNNRKWGIYKCGNCGGLVTASARSFNQPVMDIFPVTENVSEDIPGRARTFLEQAIASVHAPAGALMLCASSVDSMLKEKGYSEGSLYARIQSAVEANLLTPDMAAWAHEVRLDANDQRHADEVANLPTQEDADRAIDFVKAIAQYLFVLPTRVQRGLRVEGS